MPSTRLLKSQRAQLVDLIGEADFDPREFDLATHTDSFSGERVVLTHEPSGYYFAIGESDRGFVVEFSPGFDKQIDTFGTGPWAAVVVDRMRHWLPYLRREIETPDVWNELEHERKLLAMQLSEEAENTPFAPAEQAVISRQLGEIREYVRTNYELSEAQFAVLENRLTYLEGAAARLPRFDWQEALKGVLLTLAVEAVLPPEVIRQVLVLAMRGLAHLFGGALPELPA